MALTATAQSALPPNPSWDEMIVPTLRKRLESESLAISKRMSAASIPSGDESSYVKVFQRGGGSNGQARASTSSSSRSNNSGGGGGRSRAATSHSTASNSGATSNGGPSEKPSAIPRPSLNYSRPNLDQQQQQQQHQQTSSSSSRIIVEPTRAPQPPTEPKKQKPRPARSRTYSQPYNIINATEASTSTGATPRANGGGAARKAAVNNGSSLPTPASSRSNSPALPSTSPSDVKAPRVAKTKSKAQQQSNESSAAKAPLLTPERSPNGWQAKTSLYADPHYASSLSSISVTSTSKAGQNMTEIMYEMPPFSANSHTSSIHDDSHDVTDSHRPSAEEERPFEHWYRGDLSRNGGVGELRVGNRMEMLEIANYGHRLRERLRADAALNNAKSSAYQGRKRAESIGHRDSVYYEDADGRMVMDETPLTDMEADTEVETDREAPVEAETWDDEETQETSKVSTSTERQSTPTHGTPRQLQQPPHESQIPRPSIRAMSESPQSSAISTNRQQQYSHPVPQSQSLTLSVSTNKQNSAQKRSRTKSPVPSPSTSNSTPAGKKLKVSTVQQKRSKSNVRTPEADRSITAYPEPPGSSGGMADAIPSWTRPVPKGNWDEVVLPVVARKMGLDDQYEEATGAPEPKPTVQEIAPAPGTFGYDPSKRRERRGQDDQMDEFGQYPLPPPIPDEEPSEKTAESQVVTPAQRKSSLRPRPSMRARPPSPPPFSDYIQPSVDASQPVPSPHIEVGAGMEAKQMEGLQVEEPEEGGAGCCKCVIM